MALLLHTLGDDALRVYNSFAFVTQENARTVAEIIEKFDAFAIGEVNETYERYVFNNRSQGDSESFETFYAAIRNLAKTCNYCDNCLQSVIRDRIVLGIRDRSTQSSLLKERNLTLDQAVLICKAAETAMVQGQRLQHQDIAKVQATRPKVHKTKAEPAKAMKCKFCLTVHKFKKNLCPAWGQACSACHKKNHYAGSIVCSKRKNVNAVCDDDCDSDSSSGLSINCVTVNSVSNEAIYCEMLVGGQRIRMQVDCGATVNILPQSLTQNAEIRQEPVCLRMWNGTTLQALGRCKIKTINPATQAKYKVDYVVVKEDLTPLLSRKAAEQMSIISVNYNNLISVAAVTKAADSVVSGKSLVKPLCDFPKVFSGELGRLPGSKVHLTLEEGATPVIRPARRIPEALKPRVKSELDRLENTGVIVRVDEPTDWVNQMTFAEKKSGAVRICIDPRPLNSALKREHYRLPVLDDVLPSMSQSKKFSVFDLSQGYLHCELDEESSRLCTFATPYGRYRYLRLPFGLNASSEIFQKRLHQALDKLDGIHCIADDVVAHGRNGDDHDTHVTNFLRRCDEQGIRLNLDKCQLGLSEIHFQGHVLSSSGLKADPEKVRAILEMESPKDKEGVERLKGTVQYLSRFVPRLSEVIHPIKQLTHQGVEWQWGDAQEKAFTELKNLISEAPVLGYYNPDLDLTIQCDASSTGLGAALLQNNQPIAYASRTLTDTETRYAVIEKEMLAIVFALEKWHQFSYGRKVIVHSDHKPLESITRKPLDRAPKRLQGMLLRALAYDIEVRYVQGKYMHLADTLSRASIKGSGHEQSDFEAINALSYLPVREEQAQLIRAETCKDPALTTLKSIIQDGWPAKADVPPQLAAFYSVRDELAVCDGIVFRGERLVIPQGLRSTIKKDIHTGHAGIDGCLRRARESVYWPGMNSDIKQYIETCEACRMFESSQPKETLMSHEAPNRPWEKIGVDLMSYKEKDYLITVDYLTNFWEVDFLATTTAKSVITKLKAHFARYGIPDTLVSDCGSQFMCEEFHRFAVMWGFEHTPSSPHHHQSNGKVESSVKAAKRVIKKARASNEDQYMALLNVRNTPTQGTDSSPAQRFLGRRTKTTLPTSSTLLRPRNVDPQLDRLQLKQCQARQQKYYNRSAHDLDPLSTGDVVRIKPYRLGDKIWTKGQVIERLDDRSYKVISDDGTTYRRNRVQIRKTAEPPPTVPVTPEIPRARESVETRSTDNTEPSVPGNDIVPGESPKKVLPVKTPAQSPMAPRRSQRTVKAPERFRDFV